MTQDDVSLPVAAEGVEAPADTHPVPPVGAPPAAVAEAPAPVSFLESFQQSVDAILSAHRSIDSTGAGLRAAESDIAAAQAKLEQAQSAAERAVVSHEEARTGARTAVRDLIGQLTAWLEGGLSG